jgi:hypothetical protein
VETHKILFESLEKAEKHFEAGEIRVAQKIVNEVSRNIRAEGKVSNKLRHRFNFMSAQSRYFNDISSFATNPKRNEIIKEIESLITTPIDNPKKQANAIHSLQTKWQLLDQTSKPAGREQWNTFKGLTDKAWEPCAQYYEELKAVKVSNAKERQKIIDSIISYTNEQSLKWPNLIELSKYLSKNFQLWQNFAPVLDEDFKKLKLAYQNARKPINDEIHSQENKNYKLKNEIIEKVKLIKNEDNKMCIQQFQKLKRDYQNIGPSGKKNEPILWKMLNENADKFYKAEKSAAYEELNIIQELHKEITEADSSIPKIKDRLRELTKTRKTPEFMKLQKAIKVFEVKKAEETIKNKITSYSDLITFIESETFDDVSIHKEIRKALINPDYSANLIKLTETVVMIELLAGIESPSPDKDIRQRLTLEMLQNKFSSFSNENDQVKDLLIAFIHNIKSKKLNAKELKLWSRIQVCLAILSKNLP